ncbi:MAG: STAS/SEC14 domain-containing protein [Chthoniobacteraceae bacterium]
MITHHLDRVDGILHLQPQSKLERTDFEQLAGVVDPYLAESESLAGIIVETPGFPGWESFGAMAAHLRFVREHHRHVKKIALVTDSALGNMAEHLVAHFVAAKIRHFGADQSVEARAWILADEAG